MNGADWRDKLGALLPDDYEPEAPDEPAPKAAPKPKLVISLDRKRAGKTATIISGFEPDDPRASDLAVTLKKKLATGGSVRDGEILIQGDRVDAVKQLLRAEGYKVS